MRPDPHADTRERLLFRLKTRGPATAAALAEREGLTAAAVRQHLAGLEEEGLVTGETAPDGVGRPARRWGLTEAAEERFPEGYAELALELLRGVREAFGAEGLERLTRARTEEQERAYAAELPGREKPLSRRVAALARLRSREGYLAEWRRAGDGFTLIENHCPVCAAARVCQGICGGELELFRDLLPDATVERTEHILEGARRCAYRITPR